MRERIFLVTLVAIYWVGVFTGSLSHVPYTNANMDTFLHGAMATWGTGLSVVIVRDWYRNRAVGTRESVGQS